MAEGAALMTDTKWTSRILGTAWPQHMNKTVAETMYENIKTVGLPTWSDADQTLAKALQKELGNPRQEACAVKLGDLGVPNPERENTGGGSDDIGDVSWNCADRDAALSGEHSRPARAQLGERDRDGDADRAQGRGGRREGAGDDGARPDDAARAGQQAWDYFNNVQTKDVKYMPFISQDTPPATHLNKATSWRSTASRCRSSTTTRRSSRPISISWASSIRRCGPTRHSNQE